MKKIILMLFVFLMTNQSNIFATHLMGGQITVEHLGTDSALIKLTVYRDNSGGNATIDTLNGSMVFDIFTNPNCMNAIQSNISFDYSGMTNIGNNVEEYIFEKTLSPSLSLITGNTYLSDSSIADYFIKWELCCRNLAISNIVNPGSNSMVLQTKYHSFGVSTSNSTPVFLNQPVTTAMVNLPWQYNPLPFDADGDSLYWYIDTPWNSCQVNCVGYTMPAFSNLDPFAINSSTGQITWTPGALGNWNATVMVNEYRNGALIGFIRRDMQIIVLDSSAFNTGNKPTFTVGGTTIQNQQQFMFTIPANQPFNLITNASDIDGDDLKITLQGEPFILTNNPATYSVNNGKGAADATLTWNPNALQARQKMYNLAIRNYEKNDSSVFVNIFDVTVQLKVVETPQSTSTFHNDAQLMLSPNPANNFASLQYVAKQVENTKVIISDITGKVVKQINFISKVGTNGMFIETSNLHNGIYFVQVESNNVKSTNKIVVKH
jgi:hypothetical protein